MADNLRKDVRIASLDMFVRLARTKSQPAVAKELRCNQATVSRSVLALELWLRRMLVYPGSPIRLTEDGERFLPIAVEVLRLMHEMRGDPSKAKPPQPKVSGRDIQVPAPPPGPSRR